MEALSYKNEGVASTALTVRPSNMVIYFILSFKGYSLIDL